MDKFEEDVTMMKKDIEYMKESQIKDREERRDFEAKVLLALENLPNKYASKTTETRLNTLMWLVITTLVSAVGALAGYIMFAK